MASPETEPAVEPGKEPAVESESGGELVYRITDPELMQFREAGEGTQPMLEGIMVPYGEFAKVDSPIEGQFLESFAPGALAKTIAERATRIRVLFRHGFGFLDKQPIAEVEEMRDEPDAVRYRASLLDGLPPLLLAGLKRGLYGTSIGYKPLKWDRVRRPKKSEHNPDGWEERVVREAYVEEFSVTPFPAYAGATARIRSLTDELSVSRLMANPERLIEVIREVTREPQHSEPAEVAEEVEEAAPKESRRTPSHDYLSNKEGETPWRL